MNSITISAEKHHYGYFDPLQLYLDFVTAFGEEKVYFLEALKGPKVDAKHSLIGFDPIFKIDVKKSRVTLRGHGEILEIIEGNLGSSGFHKEEGGYYDIGGGDMDIWAFLKICKATFSIEGAAENKEYICGFFGYFGYDTVRYVEDLPYLIEDDHTESDICLAVYRHVIRIDHEQQTSEICLTDAAQWPESVHDKVMAVIDGYSAKDTSAPLDMRGHAFSVTDTENKDHYCQNVETALEYIRRGDIYQVQLGHELAITTDISPIDVYKRLRDRNPSPYMFMAKFDHYRVIGASPEVFVKVEGDVMTMRPLAGTIRCGETAEEQAKNIQTLQNDEKEIAEHVMLVDLCRNDIGRICEAKSLDVDTLLQVEKYSHVFHLVSNVTGRVNENIDVFDMIRATFPAGTMTGAPKVRAMEIIEELENSRRGLYAGAIGLIGFNGYINTALCIRSVLHAGDTYRIRASAGIVADSTPDQEWQETFNKLSGSFWAITGQELKAQ